MNWDIFVVANFALIFGVAGLLWPENFLVLFDVLMFPWPASSRVVRVNSATAILFALLLAGRLLVQ
jgi:hypothetical protein